MRSQQALSNACFGSAIERVTAVKRSTCIEPPR
jgi:hypothetical protein